MNLLLPHAVYIKTFTLRNCLVQFMEAGKSKTCRVHSGQRFKRADSAGEVQSLCTEEFFLDQVQSFCSVRAIQ